MISLTITARTSRRLSQELELKQHALKLLQERVQGSESAQLAERVTATEKLLQEANEAAATAKGNKEAMIATAKARASQLEGHKGMSISHTASGTEAINSKGLPTDLVLAFSRFRFAMISIVEKA